MSSDDAINPAIKPPYLGLLDAISIAERNAGRGYVHEERDSRALLRAACAGG